MTRAPSESTGAAPAPPGCRKCGGTMAPGKALQNTLTGMGDFGKHDVVTLSPGGPGRLVDCSKCESCGWSVSAAPAPTIQGERA